MKKLSFGLVALLAIVFAVSSSFTTKTGTIVYQVYGIDFTGDFSHEYSENPAEWPAYLTQVAEQQVEAQENPTTTEPMPSSTRPALEDFASACDDDLVQVCLILVENNDEVLTVLEVIPGEFIGF